MVDFEVTKPPVTHSEIKRGHLTTRTSMQPRNTVDDSTQRTFKEGQAAKHHDPVGNDIDRELNYLTLDKKRGLSPDGIIPQPPTNVLPTERAQIRDENELLAEKSKGDPFDQELRAMLDKESQTPEEK